MFKDEVSIRIKSGDGGKGCISFRREKYVRFGGPNGGDGGKGGNVVFKVNRHLHSLAHLHHNSMHRAESGQNGKKSYCKGKDGQDYIIEVPQGTIIRNAHTNEKIVDLKGISQEYIVAKGGEGGRGNFRFKTSINQAPRYAQPGEETSLIELHLELNLVADVGLIGFPNSGKSTLLRTISKARPKVGNYAFTTLSPNLGVVMLADYRSYIVGDMPGLIEGAHQGIGLGIQFLKHINRSKILLFVLDCTQEDTLHQWQLLQNELDSFSMEPKPYFIVINKIDLLSVEERRTLKSQFLKKWNQLQHIAKENFIDIFCISGREQIGLEELKSSIYPFTQDSK